MSTLLLTATINSGYFGNVETKISDTEIRRRQYTETLEKYITRSNFTRFVFAENSGAHLDEGYFYALCADHNKQIEFLTVLGDVEKTRRYGKSFGESQIIADAWKHSSFLKQEEVFYKVTGRVWIENINDIMVFDGKSHFIAYNYKKWAITIFFCLSRNDYETLIKGNEGDYEDASLEPWKMGEWLPCERTFYLRLMKSHQKIKAFSRYPDFRGNLGGTNLPYTKSKSNLFVRNVLNKFGFFNLKPYSAWQEKIILFMFKLGEQLL